MRVDTRLVPDLAGRNNIERLTGQKLSACYQCEKCSSGCPAAFAMDILPHRAIRLLALGQVERILNSETIWVCSGCQTCTTRCPNGIDIAHVMSRLRQLPSANASASRKTPRLFNAVFLDSVKRFGRIHETSMVSLFTLRSQGVKGLLSQAGMGLRMIAGGKLKILPSFRSDRQLKALFRQAREADR